MDQAGGRHAPQAALRFGVARCGFTPVDGRRAEIVRAGRGDGRQRWAFFHAGDSQGKLLSFSALWRRARKWDMHLSPDFSGS